MSWLLLNGREGEREGRGEIRLHSNRESKEDKKILVQSVYTSEGLENERTCTRKAVYTRREMKRT